MSAYHYFTMTEYNQLQQTLKDLNAGLKKQSDLNVELKKTFDNYKVETDKKIKEENQKIQNQITKIENNLNQKELAKEEKAIQWISYFTETVEKIKNDADYKKFVESDFDKLEYRLNLAKNNIQNKNYEAGIVASQEGLIESIEVLNKLNYLKSEWAEIFKNVKESFNFLKDFLNKHKKYEVEMTTDEGIKEKEKIDVNYWSNDKFNELLNQASVIEKELFDYKQLYKDDLLKCFDEISKITEKAPEVIDNSIKKFVNHIKRQDIQEVIADKLTKFGYHIIDNIWEKNDERKSNILLLQNGEGEKIMISLNYDTEKGQTTLDWRTDMKNHQTKQKRVAALIDALNDNFDAGIDKNQIINNPYDRDVKQEEFNLEQYK